ncbi:hypothetical protein [Haloferula sp. BvORR071]|uniref:hypothetical protein n=1 Tax=Haloferula sp. BvORR071 TaxID=1396141 RepID=UPI002240F43C|nr:hypothetical protein [Haloferula sp. BvORR071]
MHLKPSSDLSLPVLDSSKTREHQASGESITRRRFLKRTGGATAASFLAWNTSIARSKAEAEPNPSEITVDIPEQELGLDKNGYREECHFLEVTSPATQAGWVWKYGAPTTSKPQTLPHDPLSGGAFPNHYTITATVKKPEGEPWPAITFLVKGNDIPDKIKIVKSTDKGEGKWELQIRALDASTPKPKTFDRRLGGTLIVAMKGKKKVGSANVYVLRPKFINKDPKVIKVETVSFVPHTFHARMEGLPVDPTLTQGSVPPATSDAGSPNWNFSMLRINILDQYKKALSGVYAGTVLEEDINGAFDSLAFIGTGGYDDPIGADGFGNFTQDFHIKIAGWPIDDKMKREVVTSNIGGGDPVTVKYTTQYIIPTP